MLQSKKRAESGKKPDFQRRPTVLQPAARDNGNLTVTPYG
jgi:hypothetical protein